MLNELDNTPAAYKIIGKNIAKIEKSGSLSPSSEPFGATSQHRKPSSTVPYVYTQNLSLSLSFPFWMFRRG